MKTFMSYFKVVVCLCLGILTITSCKEDDDNRTYEGVAIVNAYVNGAICSNVTRGDKSTTIQFQAGMSLENMRVKLVVINGSVIDFANDTEMDCRKPIPVRLRHFDGTEEEHTLQFVSKPALQDFFIEGISVNPSDIFFTNNKLIARVPEGTPLTALKVTMTFLNGETDFTNGVARDLTNPIPFNITGVDGITVYPYELMVSDQPIGPASINSIKVAGKEVASFSYPVADVDGNSVVAVNLAAITNLSDATVEFGLGLDNKLVNFENGTKLNFFTNPVVSIVGTNGVVTHFKFELPKVAANLISTLGATNESLGAAFTGNYVVAAGGSLGNIRVFDALQGGDVIKSLNTGGMTAPSGIVRKIASDVDGKIVAITLSHSTKNFVVYKWEDVDATPVAFIEYEDQAAANVRTAGIRVKGSLAGNAEVFVTMVGAGENVLKFVVTNGVVNQTPVKLSTGAAFGNFASVEGIAGSENLLMTNLTADNKLISLTNGSLGMITEKRLGSGSSSTHTIVHGGRTYAAYVALNAQGGNLNSYKICDITDMSGNVFENELFVYNTTQPSALGNGTSDAGFAVINGKLHVLFTAENAATSVFCLE